VADDQTMAVAAVYADSLFHVATERGAADTLLDELLALADVVRKDEGLRDFLSSPLLETDERAAAIEKAFRGNASDLLVDALQVINRKGRSAMLPAIVEAYRRRVDRAAGRVDVDVRSAVALSDGLRGELVAALHKLTGREPRLREVVDANLLAGMVVQIGDQKFDTSAAAALGRLESALLERASRQIVQGTEAVEA
jgi:F-type H+-transporting ATPase subunit delta